MNVYEVLPSFEFKSFFTPRRNDLDQFLFTPVGQSIGTAWKGLTVYNGDPNSEDYPGELPAGDFVGLIGSEIGVTPRALELVGGSLRVCGELLPITCPDHPQPILWFRPTVVVDALDVDRSVAKPIGGSPDRLFVTRHAFYAERLRDALVFRIPQDPGPTFCTDAFKRLVESHGLTGLGFRPVWSNEPDGIGRANNAPGQAPGAQDRP